MAKKGKNPFAKYEKTGKDMKEDKKGAKGMPPAFMKKKGAKRGY